MACAAKFICGSAGIGRQARLRGVCCTTYGFKSHLPHQTGNPETTEVSGFFLLQSILFSVKYYPFRALSFPSHVNFCKIISHGISHRLFDGFISRIRGTYHKMCLRHSTKGELTFLFSPLFRLHNPEQAFSPQM